MNDWDRDTFFFAAPKRRRSIVKWIAATWAAVFGSFALATRAARHGYAEMTDGARRIGNDVRRVPRAIVNPIARDAREMIQQMRRRIGRLSTPGPRMRRTAVIVVATMASLALALPAFAGTSTDSGFEGSDGNLVVGTTFDWNGFAPVAWTGTAPLRVASKVASGWTFTGIEDRQATTADSGFAGGTKQDDNCPSVITAKAPNKDDLKRIYITNKTGSDGHVYLALAWARIPQNTTSSSAHVAFEFNQNDPATDACGAGSDSLVERSTANGGDMLVVYDFEGGSSPAVIKVLRWTTTGTCEQTGKAATSAGCWVDTGTSDWEAKVNDAAALDTIAPSPPETLQSQEFGEAVIDLTDAGVFPLSSTSCISFGRAFGVSRSSGNSGTAQMKDLVGPADVSISNCGSVVVKKVTKDVAGNVITNDSTQFTFSTNVQTLPGPNAVANFNLTGQPSGTPSDTKTIDNVQPNTLRTVTESLPAPSPYALVNINCVGGSNFTPTLATGEAKFDIASGQTVTCTFTNQKQRQESAMNTAPFVYPNDTATVTPSTATGSVEFKLYGPTTGKTAADNCAANTATGLLYSETVNLPASGTKTVSTHNPGTTGSPTSFKIDAAGASTVYWRVTYSGDTNLFGRVSCAENIAVTLTGDTSGGTNVP